MKSETMATLFQSNRISNIQLILLACLVTYMNATITGFLALDDISYLEKFHSGSVSFKELFSLYDNRFFRPLIALSFLLDFKIFGPNPGMIHLVGVIIHISNVLLVYYLALELIEDKTHKDRYALIAALIFALHPVNSEAVLWSTARGDLLCVFFFLLTLILLVKRTSSVSPFILVCLSLSFLCALLAKESAFTLLILAPLYFIMDRKRIPWKNASAMAAAMLFSTLMYFCMRNGLTRTVDNGIGKVISNDKSILTLCWDSVTAYGFYLGKMVYPFPLNFTIAAIDKSKCLVIFLILMSALAVIFHRKRNTRLPILMLLTGLVLPLMVLIGNLTWVPYAERYLYLPLTGFSIAVALLFVHFSEKIPYSLVLAGVLLLAVPTAQRVNLWTDPIAFWGDAVRQSPQFATPRLLLAAEFINNGEYAEARRQLQGALEIGLNREIDRGFAMKILATLDQEKDIYRGKDNPL